jgi:TRCF domain
LPAINEFARPDQPKSNGISAARENGEFLSLLWLAALADRREIEGFAAALIDRSGPLPREIENLLEIAESSASAARPGSKNLKPAPKKPRLTGIARLLQALARLPAAPSRDAAALPPRPRNWSNPSGGTGLNPGHQLMARIGLRNSTAP